MASIRERILQRFVQLLDGPGKPAGLTVHRYRTRAIESDKLPAQVVYPAARGPAVAETVERWNQAGDLQRTLTVRVESRVAGNPPDEALDPYYLWAVEAVMADPTLGGLAFDVQEEAVSFDAEEFQETIGACAVDFRVTYITSGYDPEKQR